MSSGIKDGSISPFDDRKLEEIRISNVQIDEQLLDQQQPRAQQEYRTYPIRFYGLTVIGLLNISSSLSWLSVAPVPDYAAVYLGNVSLTIVNWFSNVFMLVYLAAGPLSSFVYDRWSIKVGLVSGAVLQTLGSWLRFFSYFIKSSPEGRLGLALLGQVICALGQPFILNSATPYAALWFSPDGRGSATTIGANAVGLAIASLIIPILVTNPDEMWIGLLFQAVFTTATAIPAFFIPRNPKSPPSYSADTTHERRMPFGKSLKLLFTNYNFVIIWLSFGILCGLFSSITSLMPQILIPYGISVDEASYATIAFVIAGIVGAVTSGLVLDKFNIYKLMLKICVPIAGFMYLAMLFVVKEDNYVPIVVICAAMGFFSFALLPVGLELSVECSYPISESISSPLLWLCSQVAGLVTLVGMDALRDDNGDPPGNMRRSLILATCLAMPMMLFTAVYSSRNKRLETEAAGCSVASQ